MGLRDVRGSFVQGCEVCCNPWTVRVECASGFRVETPADPEADLTTVKALGVSREGPAFHSAQAHQRHESFFGKPVLVPLRAERRLKVPDLLSARSHIEGHEAVGRAKIAIELGDLVLENQMIAEGVPGEIRQRAVVLMAILAIVHSVPSLATCPSAFRKQP